MVGARDSFLLGACRIHFDLGGRYLANYTEELGEPRVDFYKLTVKLARGDEVVRMYY